MAAAGGWTVHSLCWSTQSPTAASCPAAAVVPEQVEQNKQPDDKHGHACCNMTASLLFVGVPRQMKYMAAAGGWAVAALLKERQTPTAASCYAAAAILVQVKQIKQPDAAHASCWWVGCGRYAERPNCRQLLCCCCHTSTSETDKQPDAAWQMLVGGLWPCLGKTPPTAASCCAASTLLVQDTTETA
jgi:hypothetical protein